MSKEQYSIICRDTDSTEYEFKEIVNNLYQTITTMPEVYEQDGKSSPTV
jgi:hypothetical protein